MISDYTKAAVAVDYSGMTSDSTTVCGIVCNGLLSFEYINNSFPEFKIMKFKNHKIQRVKIYFCARCYFCERNQEPRTNFQ